MARKLFTEDSITNAKRVVRGEHYLFASKLLNSRSLAFQSKFECLILAGECPQGDITSLRTAIPRAIVTAADKSETAIQEAIKAGADRAICCDIFEFNGKTGLPLFAYDLPFCIPVSPKNHGPRSRKSGFDLISMDLCGNITPKLIANLRRYYNSMLANGGVFILTISYGRDASDAFVRMARGGEFHGKNTSCLPVSDSITGRIISVTMKPMTIKSILIYRGKQMPMFSILFERVTNSRFNSELPIWPYDKGVKHDFMIQDVTDDDLRLACLSLEDCSPADLYDVPATRIAAWRAVQSRQTKDDGCACQPFLFTNGGILDQAAVAGAEAEAAKERS